MRLWSLHPALLDRVGLVALWREGLLAQQVLLGRTRGYRHHPQLARFRAASDPVVAISTYLWAVRDEAVERGYRFDETKIAGRRSRARRDVTRGQLEHELDHLARKLRSRDPEWLHSVVGRSRARAHPMFRVVRGPIEPWERAR